MKKYDTYKNSGIQWIGQVPEHWKIGKIKVLCDSIFAGATPSTGNQEYWEGGSIPWIPSGCCHDCKINEAPKYITEAGLQNSSTKLIPANTTVMALTGATCAQLGYLTIEACANQSVVAFVENKQKADSRFLYYSLFAAREEILTHKSGGAQGGINQEDCRNIQIAIISLFEQQAIANFLDKKTGEIDKAISLFEQEKLDLLAYRKAIISETVTKGLNPNAKLKDSGIQWIGQIPEEWSVVKMKYCFEDIYSGDSIRAEELDEEGKYPVYGGGAIISHANKYNVCAGDIIIGRVGANCGCVTYLTQNAWATDNALVVKSAIDSRYLFHQLIAADLNSLNSSNAQPLITASKVKDVKFACPKSISGQKEIAEYIDKKTSDIDTAIERINAQITELQAYRTALISEAVTGKIDVR